MTNGKHSRKNTKRRLRWSKQFVLLVSVAVLLMGSIGGTLAYLVANAGPVENKFTPGQVNIKVQESFDGTTKTNVSIENTGNVDAKIRAMIVVTWQNGEGKVYPQKPEAGKDYIIEGLPGSDWAKVGNWYEYNTAVAPDGSTSYLFTKCEPKGNTPDGYSLVVDIIAEAIQSGGGASF